MAVTDPIAYVLRIARRLVKEGALASRAPELYGVMFDVSNHRAYLMSHHFIARISGVGAFNALAGAGSRTFYDFNKESWTTNQYPYDLQKMAESIRVPTVSSLYLPIYHTLREIKDRYDTFIQRRDIRVVIDVSLGPTKEEVDLMDSTEEMLLTFSLMGGVPICQHPSVAKLIRVDDFSKVPSGKIKEGRFYVARRSRENEDSVIVSVQRELVVGQRVGLWESKNQLFSDQAQMMELASYPEQSVIRYPVIKQQEAYDDYRPVVLGGTYFYEMLLLMQHFPYVDVCSRYAAEKVLLRAVRPASDWPEIEIMAGQYQAQ